MSLAGKWVPVVRSLRGAAGRSLAAPLSALRPGRSSPFVTQSELAGLMRADRSDIERQVRQAEWMMRHPQRGMTAAPYLLMGDGGRFLCWVDAAIADLGQPRPVPDLEDLIRAWQDHRGIAVAPNLRWRRRADVIAVERHSRSRGASAANGRNTLVPGPGTTGSRYFTHKEIPR